MQTAHLPIRDERGSSLIEALVSISIMGVVAASVFQMVTLTYVTSSRNQLQHHATTLAKAKLESLRAVPFATLTGLSITGIPDATNVIEGVNFTTAASVVSPPSSLTPLPASATDMAQVQVSVSWSDHGSPRAYVVDSVYTDVNQGNVASVTP